nr:unnamed protein product [Digitaria exilis]
MSAPKSAGDKPLALSTPAGKDGWEGNGRTSARTALRCAARSGARRWAVAGVATTVRRRPPREDARRAARSRRGIVWPCAGYGTTRTCGGGAAGVVGRLVAVVAIPDVVAAASVSRHRT